MVRNNVEKIRVSKGISKTFLAKKLGLTVQGYRHIVNGHTRLDVERLKIIASSLGVDVAVFFDDKLTESVVAEQEFNKTKTAS